jgi:hypothetical protein
MKQMVRLLLFSHRSSAILHPFYLLALCTASALAADPPLAWPRFRGPEGSGVADNEKPPVEVGPDKNVKWRIAAPSGLSSPIVVGDMLVMTAFEGGKLYTIAYHRTDGSEAWRSDARAKRIEQYNQTEGSPAASTPVTDGKRIVSYFGSCGLVCHDLWGKELWRFDMSPPNIFGNFGSGVSPILTEETVILVRDETMNARILAFEAATGKPQWEKKRQSRVSYCTPVVWDTPDGKQLVVAGQGRMIGYDLKTGAEKWFLAGMPTGPCSSPLVAEGTLYFAGWSPGGPDDKENQLPSFDVLLKQADTNKDGALSREEAQKTDIKDIFDALDTNQDGKVTHAEWDALIKMMSEGQNSAFALPPGTSGEVKSSNLLWKKTKGLPYVPSPLVYRGQCVMVKDGGLVTAYDAKTGRQIYLQERVIAPGRYYASPVAANGFIYFTSLDDGVITVLKAGTARPEVAAKNPKLGERVAATPAVADDTLYVRTAGHLYAFAEPKK